VVFAGLLRELAEFSSERGVLLDLGAATGALLHQAQLQGWTPVGLEPSEPARDFARRRYGLALLPGFLGQQPLPEAACVTMLDVLEHLPAPRAALQAAARALRPGGLIALLTPNWDCLARRLLGGAWDAIVPDGHLQYFRAPVLAPLLERAGLKILRAGTRGLRPFNRRPRLRRLGESLGWGEALWFIARREARA
jgi:SAM-dependent methyltransferase